jgi:hypothetical protein
MRYSVVKTYLTRNFCQGARKCSSFSGQGCREIFVEGSQELQTNRVDTKTNIRLLKASSAIDQEHLQVEFDFSPEGGVGGRLCW